MKFVKQSFEIIPQEEGIDGLYKHIELAGRTCYSPDTEVLTNNGWKRFDNERLRIISKSNYRKTNSLFTSNK